MWHILSDKAVYSILLLPMTTQILTARKFRHDSRYSRDEMQVISKYKQEYREQTTRDLRHHVFKGKILVDLFNYWLAQGQAPDTEADSATRMKVSRTRGRSARATIIVLHLRQDLAAWVRNNWRPLSTTSGTKAHLKVTAINLVWELEKEAVEAELMVILGVELLDPNDPGYFQQRNAAAKRVLARMTERKRANLNAIVMHRRSQGHPDNIRRE